MLVFLSQSQTLLSSCFLINMVSTKCCWGERGEEGGMIYRPRGRSEKVMFYFS